ncbi:class I SAM-dependent methyltransferase [Qipengyuania marisflavi]|nr:class I SAM-dependent methyltransferase [Qipengyuania marisflavi]
MTEQSEWTGRVGASWAHEWQRTDRSFGPLTERLLATAQAEPFAYAVDIGCGAGEVTYRLAADAQSSRVLGLDVSEELVAIARQRIGDLTNASVTLGDAAMWQSGDSAPPDLLVSRHGVMFFADPTAAFAHMRSQCSAGARLVFSCFRERAANPWALELSGILPAEESAAPADPNAPGPFAFGDRGHVSKVLIDAGWSDIAFEAIDYAMVGGNGKDALEDALSYFQRIGPAARTLAELTGVPRDAALAHLRRLLETHHTGDIVSLDASAWIVTARAPA